MKKFTSLFFIFMLAYSTNSLYAQQNSKSDTSSMSEIIIVRLVEMVGAAAFDSEMIIYYGENKYEKIELKNITMKGYPISNLEKIHIVISRLYGDRYELVNSYASGGGTNLIFKKKLK